MKICYLADVNNYHTKKWCRFFRNLGHEIIVISLTRGELEGIQVYSFEETELRKRSDFSKLSYLSKIKEIKKIVAKEKPDIVHAHFASSYGLIGSLLKFSPYILSVWGSDVYIFPNKSLIHKLLLRHNLKKADYLWSTSEAMMKETKKYIDKPIQVTPFGVDTEVFKPMSNKYRCNDKFIIGITKTLSKIYGINYLIESLPKVISSYPELRIILRIVGKGEEENSLKKLVEELNLKENVEFVGYIDNEEAMAEQYNQFDIAVFPSLFESFGVSAIEAQSCGIPVIVTNVGGLPYVINRDKSGLVINKENTKEIANSICYMIDNREKLSLMGANGRQFVIENYEINNNFSSINRLYNEIIEKT